MQNASENPYPALPAEGEHEKLRINFVLPPCGKISGGPLAILEYANRFIAAGHSVSVTTYPDSMWEGSNPFPWFDFKGPIHYKRTRSSVEKGNGILLPLSRSDDVGALAVSILSSFGLGGVHQLALTSLAPVRDRAPFEHLLEIALSSTHIIEAIPPCDLNIATRWDTTFPVVWSQKGKPVYFMQHYEEIFYPLVPVTLFDRLLARLSYMLPLYKVANSSWLQTVIKKRYGQDVPFSNNGMVLSDFSPRPKLSALDGIIRVFTYSRPDDWKGFGEAVAAMAMVRAHYGARVEWNVFGYQHPDLPEDNQHARYTYHPKLSFRELAHLYAVSDIALCPSWYESFPLPPLEAMASGTAVITTDYGTEDYAFHDQNALVVGTRDVNALFEAVCRLVDDEALRTRLADEGLTTASKFTWDTAVAKREQILLDIHHERISYDRFAPAKLGLVDSLGFEFERAPADVKILSPGIVAHRDQLFLVQDGLKRHITEPALIPDVIDRDLRFVDPDALNFVRTPQGFPVGSKADLPVDAGSKNLDTPSFDSTRPKSDFGQRKEEQNGHEGLFWHEGHLYLIHGGYRRYVTNPELIPVFKEMHLEELKLNGADLAALPLGLPVSKLSELPVSL